MLFVLQSNHGNFCNNQSLLLMGLCFYFHAHLCRPCPSLVFLEHFLSLALLEWKPWPNYISGLFRYLQRMHLRICLEFPTRI
nr:hypothetical protein Iba_chr05aCG10300 [Ipomoea batatas]GMD84113.1 hypothetical protein Iba_chr14aCG11580 [Ipomoea batatas]GMD87500.1 hypothetical protein Iba_chr14bCG16360 [Ipomoea batatas]